MANSFMCSDCKKDGTRCNCHEKRNHNRQYQTSREDFIEKKKLEIEGEWRRLGVDFKF